MWIKWQEQMPKVNQPVLCLLKHDHSGKQIQEKLIHVDADDYTWVTADDHSQLNEWAWTVMGWKYINT